MNRRQVMAVLGTGGLALAGRAAEPVPALKVSIVLPELFGLDGQLALAPTLRNAGYGFRFVVVVENVSAADVFVWAEGNSWGHGALSFEMAAAGAKTVVRRVERDWSKNIARVERLVPGGHHVRVVEYDAPPGKAAQWEGFPFGAKNTRRDVTLRAVFEQPKADGNGKLQLWAGRVQSAAYKVVLESQ